MHKNCLAIIITSITLLTGLVTSVEAAGWQPPFEEKVYTDREYETRMIDAIRDYIPHAMRTSGAPGLNIALAYRGRLIWEAGFGYADVASKKPMTPATVYHSGSLGKTYTATAIMHLVDRGVIALDDPINQYLPFEVHNPKGNRDITIYDLMTHTSGLGADDALSLWWKPRPLAVELEDEYSKEFSSMLGGKSMPRWQYQVGEHWLYSNLGLATLGLIVETANPDSLSFGNYVQKYVMDPLGMTSSQYPPAQHEDYVKPKIWQKMSTGYSSMGSALIPTLPVYFGEYPAGGVLARPSDHLRLLLAMMNRGSYNDYQLLKPETVIKMLTPQDIEGEPGPDIQQGLIWRLREYDKPTRAFSHAGGHMFGWRTQGQAWPELDAAVMIAINQWGIPAPAKDMYKIVKFVGDWIATLPTDLAYTPVDDQWGWKTSYVRGAIFAAAYSTWVGIPGEMPIDALEASIASTRLIPGERDDWNPEAFRKGVADMNSTGLSLEGVVGFWGSEACKVSLDEAQTIYQELGGLIPGTMSMIFPPETKPESK